MFLTHHKWYTKAATVAYNTFFLKAPFPLFLILSNNEVNLFLQNTEAHERSPEDLWWSFVIWNAFWKLKIW